MNFITLTKSYKDTKVRINFDEVAYYEEYEEAKTLTKIVFDITFSDILVIETPKEIDELLNAIQ